MSAHTIKAPGIYPDFPLGLYFQDPTPEPSITQSIAKILINESPAHAHYAHPRLGPDRAEEAPTKEQTIGDVVHKMLLGRGRQVVEAEFSDYKTVCARKFRDDALLAGRIPILSKHLNQAHEIVAAAAAHLHKMQWMQNAERQTEVVAVSREEGIWLRTLIDWLEPDRRTIYDVKTLSTSVSPINIARTVINSGWDVQAAFQQRVLDAVDPSNAGRRQFRFVAIEQYPPYAVCCVVLPESVMTIGRKKVDFALRIWADCIERNRWDAYPGIYFAELPAWAESGWLARELDADSAERKERDRFSPNILLAG